MGAAESREDATRSDRRILHGPSKPAQRLPTDRDQNPSKGGKGDVEYWKALGLIVYPDEDEEEDTDICKVVDGLYLGGMEGAADLKALQARGITHILNLSNYQQNPEVYREDKFQYLIINIPDLPTENLRAHWDRTNAFIREGLRFGQVYVHCFAGVSRAPATVAAHLVYELGLDLEAALKLVRRARPFVRPNSGFMRQLEEYSDDCAQRRQRKSLVKRRAAVMRAAGFADEDVAAGTLAAAEPDAPPRSAPAAAPRSLPLAERAHETGVRAPASSPPPPGTPDEGPSRPAAPHTRGSPESDDDASRPPVLGGWRVPSSPAKTTRSGARSARAAPSLAPAGALDYWHAALSARGEAEDGAARWAPAGRGPSGVGADKQAAAAVGSTRELHGAVFVSPPPLSDAAPDAAPGPAPLAAPGPLPLAAPPARQIAYC